MNRLKKLKKYAGPAVMMGIYILLGVFCGMIVTNAADRLGGGVLLMMALLLLGVYGSILIHIIAHEAGHMVCGLMTGYRFVSFRIGSFVWQKTREGKLSFGRSPLPGAGGQCLMSPPDLKDGSMSVALYNLGGVMMNGLLSLLSLAAAGLCAHPAGDVLFQIFAVIGLMLGSTNGIPLRLGAVDNDGYNLLTLSRSKEAVRALWVQLKVAGENAWGVRLRDMPEEWFALPTRQGMKNSLCAAVAVFRCGRLLDALKFEEAAHAMQEVFRMGNGMAGLHAASMKIDLAYCRLMLGEGREAAEKQLDGQTKKIMKAMKTNLGVLRTQYAMALLGEGDAEQADRLLCQFERAAKTWPSRADVESERELIACAQEKAKETGEGA